MVLCKITQEDFLVTPFEKKLRDEFGLPEPDILPHLRIRQLGAFWPHWALHKRQCGLSKKDIISVFHPRCPYPVWHKDIWYKNAQPPQTKINFEESFFTQASKLFFQCPIPHNSGIGNESCEFTDDWWYGRDCYLCHCGVRNENCRYSYRVIGCKDCMYATFCFECEQCFDTINSEKCFSCIYGLYLKNCQDSAFCYDCRNCSDCLFCFNLRNKRYCIGNKQLTEQEYYEQKKQFEYRTPAGYEHCKQLFQKMMREIAWHKSFYLDFAENSTGNYSLRLKNVQNTFFGGDGEDAVNVTRYGWAKTAIDSINLQEAEKIVYTSGAQIKCYEIGYSFMLDNSRFALYSGYSSRCENIFGCCGLLNGKNAILNTAYGTGEFQELRKKIIEHMKSTGEWGQFFPGSFAASPYDESWGSLYFPLTQEEQKTQGFQRLPEEGQATGDYDSTETIPHLNEAKNTEGKIYWDNTAKKPFQILPHDIFLCQKLDVALPYSHYMRRVRENFSWMPYDGALRKIICAKSGINILTSWPREYDARILSEAEYNAIIT